MSEGLLCPAPDCLTPAYLSPPTKHHASPSMTDSHSTLCTSQMISSVQVPDLKTCSFKKIKEMKLRQKGERVRVVKQFVLEP